MPAGALTTDVTIRIARDSTGAPAIPADLTASGSMYVITPHGGDFASPVEVRIPAPSVTLDPNQEFKLAKAQPGGEWVVLADTQLDEGVLSVDVDSFSYFVPVIVTYVLPIAQAAPFSVGSQLTCAERPCNRSMGTVTATFTATSNNGQLPEGCTNPVLGLFEGNSISYSSSLRTIVPITGGSITRVLPQTGASNSYRFGVARRCGGSSFTYGSLPKEVRWTPAPNYPNVIVLSAPATLDLVEGALANLEVVLGGGASRGPDFNPLFTNNDRAIIDWERSDDSGASWRVIARSFENEANPWPISGAHLPWYYWSVRHGFIATIADQGALIRAHACYTPPSGAAPPCADGPATRLNVLQQSALPAIVDAPRSVLVRTGQTANLSVTASGLPAPTLSWQTRAANSTGAWTDVIGAGANTANYTTPAMALADNGIQYRVLATNAVGSAASTAVTVSVSDLDVAPSITTQPASLNVASGSDAVFAVNARGTEALSYQWYRDGAALTGANSPVLRITDVSSLNSGNYSARVSNSAGTADSNVATLNVYRSTPADIAPTIVTQPAAVTVNAGNTATFAVGVDGSGPFTFQWRKDGVNIQGATSAVLTLQGVTASSAGSYSVVVSNAASSGVTSSAAVLTVNPASVASAPSITTQPATLIVAPGGSGILAVAATGTGPLSYQWLKDGVAMGGETSAVLFIGNAGPSSEGRYAVRVSNSVGAVTSDEAQVILLGTPVVTQQPVAATVPEGDTATFSVVASGSDLRYQWLLNSEPIVGANLEDYTTNSLSAANSGAVYSVIVYNSAGLVFSQGAVLTVLAFTPPSVIEHPADTSIEAGSTATLCAAFAGTPPFTVQMTRWSGTAWQPVLAARSVNDNAQVCSITPVLQLEDSGAVFRFEAVSGPNGAFGTTTNAATVTVTAPTSVITTTTLASRATSGATADNRSSDPSVSANGNLVAFKSDGTNLVPGFTNPGNGYVRDLETGVTTVVNQTPAGTESSRGVVQMKLAAGGRYVVFSSLAGDLVAGDTNGSLDVFLRDLQTDTTKRLTLLADGSELMGTGNGVSDMRLDISADGRYVIFSDFYDFSTNGAPFPTISLFLRDTVNNQTSVIVADPTYGVAYAALASGGGYAAYTLAIPAPFAALVSLVDLQTNVSGPIFSMEQAGGADYLDQGLSISGNGRYVAFAVRSPALFGTTVTQAVVADVNDPNTVIVASTGSAGSGIGMGNGTSNYPKLSDDGRYVLFASQSSNLSGNVGNTLDWALMLRDLQAQTTTVASRRADGTPVRTANGVYNSHAISGNGSVVGFAAYQTDMGDGNVDHQVYVAPRP